MRRSQLLVLSLFLAACASGVTDDSLEVTLTTSPTTAPTRTSITASPSTTRATTTTGSTTSTTQAPTTTIRSTTTSQAPTTTTTRAATTTTLTTTTTTIATPATTAPPTATVTITAINFAFSPAAVTINRGDTVQWVLGSGSHTTTSGVAPNPDGGWDQTITSPVAIVFSQPGQFSFFCRFHPEMQGTIVVP